MRLARNEGRALWIPDFRTSATGYTNIRGMREERALPHVWESEDCDKEPIFNISVSKPTVRFPEDDDPWLEMYFESIAMQDED
jgi:hypothetical protein